jgi:hypothetical protein
MFRTALISPAAGSSTGQGVGPSRSAGSLVRRALGSLAAAGAMSMLALATLGATAAPLAAQTVGLTHVGPVDPVAGFPFYYEDSTGLRLQLCQNAGLCAFVLPNPGPLSFPTNYPDEQFYYLMSGDMTGVNGATRLLYISALEAGFVNGSPVAGEQMVFTRMRLRITGLVDGATYTITHPYGTKRVVAGVDGPTPGSVNITEDIGLAAGAFSQALAGNVGPFVVPTAFTVRAPGLFISDNATLTPVTGSPFGTNFLRIQGPNAGLTFPANALNNNTAQINAFVLQGQVDVK